MSGGERQQPDGPGDGLGPGDYSSDEFEAELDGFPTSTDEESLRARLPLELLASQFIEKHRQGLNPTIEEYVARYPRMAEEILDFFPMVLAMERWKGDHEATVLRSQLPEKFDFNQLGDCRLVRELGRGGMGVVFEGRRGPSQQRVAVKLLPWKFQHVPRWRERFEREARIVSGLRHRNIVPVYAFGEHEGYCYFVMQLIEGVGLDWIIARLRERQGVVYADEIVRIHDIETAAGAEAASDQESAAALGSSPAGRPKASQRGLRTDSWKGFATIGLHVSQALHYAHQRGTLHNDIKPANLLLDASGHVWVTDFGVAQQLEQDESPAASDRLTGTLRFMAPERLQGSADARSDVYSLGATLYELVTLVPAFAPGTSGELAQRILDHQVEPPGTLNKQIPFDLESIIVMAMALDPEDRYASAAEMAADLLRFLNDEKTVAGHKRKRGVFGRFFGRK